MVAAALQYVLHGVLTRWTPQRFVEAAWRTQATHPAVRHVDPFRAKPRALFAEPGRFRRQRDAPVGPHHPMPGQPGLVARSEKPSDQPGTPRQPGTTRHLAVARHLSRGNGPYRSENALRGVARIAVHGHGASIAMTTETEMLDFLAIHDFLDGEGYDIRLQDGQMMCVELSLEQGRRHQSIFLSRIADEDGREFLRVTTAVSPMTGIDARRALVFNWSSQVGYLAIGDLDGVPHLQLCENRPMQGLELSEVQRLVLEIGGLGDRMERTFSAGGDLF